jgi:2-polyprenyl-3-methyl-5-hydroxy-6-metoxy-1,4-benzoquinol methylase
MVEIRRKNVLDNIKKYPHDCIAEIGCGEEPLFLYMDDYSKMLVVEPGKHFYENARLKANGNPLIYLYNSFVENCCDLINHDIDMLIVSSLLHEVADSNALLSSLEKLCSPNTVVHINVPNAMSFHRLLAKEMGLIKTEYEFSNMNIQMQQNTVFSIDSLCQTVENAGFEILEHGSYFIKPFTHAQMQLLIDSGILTQQMLNGLVGLERHMPGLGSEIYVNCKIKL